MIEAGSKVEDFTLKDEQGNDISLADFKGKKVVLYFYPKDNTPGCTKQACSFRDVYDDILETGAVIIGISPDKPASHKKFKEKFNLPFYLLCDEDHKVAEIFGAWGEKKMYGKTYMGIIRSTFIIDEDMSVIKVYPKVTPEGHGEEILDFIKR
ncbi:thioredoxin-dependent thiol peroxidase [Pseudobacteroides cellulosolvens]|uniref:thioredoxin-dependent peroxiredoxin n=1 Tax=Pseudobacteroides cellulosolvens ATCC 35603 = DSM 2933 TaxID=398512 RepID=A0A0L6JP97_9FIRM|nr:thioredoxin-dependent thiol peroxidase [Pseudobacteroides cellulosolvens]KNY27530.1 alkyl hydroperoxide reductase/ Thiol specific antioxidant/ Mal allergen [Pseudobacteroides cellulosolvens ATCC 35603 = DSM 2933]